ncbi:isochorismate synthase [Calothrix sp. 336/3]|uniref:isochorismate synthase n=1 Tax=Calothrix sp. 336/3 TaxID=1337936 RepID=UPI0004E3EE4C|nr:isochorismate synthase [Calothrix sp. 336/3]AKG22316.1 isochorismate synthase [Calothrix sp. 336/3]
MTVSPCPADFVVYNQEIYQFLLTAQRYCLKNDCLQIASIALEIDQVDPLLVLEKFAQANQLYFYWENKVKQEAIAALESVEKLHISGSERFTKSEDFIKFCIKNIISFGCQDKLFSRPLFFCSFSFFCENSQLNYPFSPATIFLPRWQVAVKDNRCLLVANLKIDAQVDIEKLLKNLWQKIEAIQALKYSKIVLDNYQHKFQQKFVATPEEFKSSVFSALETINAHQLRKVVLANALDVKSHRQFSLVQSLEKLRQSHPNCYIFATSNGQGQNFIGASPERLISIYNQQLITDALAGSAPRGKTSEEDRINANRLLNNEKERHEHYLVIDFITQSLSQLGLLPQFLAPRLRQLSNIQHLWTPISALVPNTVHPLQIVTQLHPTPAVAGATREVACREIRRYENFERGLYAAPLGWIDTKGNCEFIVGIRSALIDGDRSRLYAGAGIVAGSNPEKELAEIQLKFQALLKGLV